MLLMFLCAVGASAQDVIVKKDGSTVICRVVEVNASEIVYKKWTDLNGSNYVMNRADASAINYQSGKRETLGEMTNFYTPNNQNEGVQMFNDKALLQLSGSPKAKKLKTIGWIGGSVLLGIGVACLIDDGGDTGTDSFSIGLVCTGGAIVWTSAFLIAAHSAQNRWLSYSIYQQKFNFKNSSSLTAGVDILKDRKFNNQTIGVGLNYNF